MTKENLLDWLEMIGGKVREGCTTRVLLGTVRALEEELIWDMGREQQFKAATIDDFLNARLAGAEKNRPPG